MLDTTMPITTATELQRNYAAVAKRAKRLKKPITVLRNNKPSLIVVDYNTYRQREKSSQSVKDKPLVRDFFGMFSDPAGELNNIDVEIKAIRKQSTKHVEQEIAGNL